MVPPVNRVLLLFNKIATLGSFDVTLPCSHRAQGLVGEAVTDQIHHKRYHYKMLWTYTSKIFPQILGVRWGCSRPRKSPEMWELIRAASGTLESSTEGTQSLCSCQPPSLLMACLLPVCDRLCVSSSRVTPALSAHVHSGHGLPRLLGPEPREVGGVSH